MKQIDQIKLKQYQSKAASNAIKTFFLGVLLLSAFVAFNLFYFKENPTSKFTVFSTYILLIVSPVIFAPTARSTSENLAQKIYIEFNTKPNEFKFKYAYGMLSEKEETKLLTKKYYKQQLFLSSLTGYFLVDTVLIILHFSLKE